MSNYRKLGLAGLGTVAFTGMLLSFNMNDDEKKKYQIIHSEKGEVVEYDTLIPMNSSYTVDQFLADKGISNEGVEIVRIPSMGDEMMFMHSDDHGGANVFIKEMTSESSGSGDVEMEVIKIIKEENDNGEVTIKKIVNGEEVEMTAEDLKKLESIEDGSNERMKVIKMELDDEDFEFKNDGSTQVVKIVCEMDDEENLTTKKTVNGKEVELTEEELEHIKIHKGDASGEHKVIRIDVESDGEMDENIEMQIEEMIEEIHEIHGEEGSEKVIIKHIDSDGKEGEQTWVSHHDSEVKVISDGDEDFTLVLVSENFDDNTKVKVKTKRK